MKNARDFNKMFVILPVPVTQRCLCPLTATYSLNAGLDSP